MKKTTLIVVFFLACDIGDDFWLDRHPVQIAHPHYHATFDPIMGVRK